MDLKEHGTRVLCARTRARIDIVAAFLLLGKSSETGRRPGRKELNQASIINLSLL